MELVLRGYRRGQEGGVTAAGLLAAGQMGGVKTVWRSGVRAAKWLVGGARGGVRTAEC